MPSASREVRKKRRLRRNVTLWRKLYQNEALSRAKVQTVLLAILGRAGGKIEVSRDDINTAAQNLGRVQYEVEKARPDVEPFDGIFEVRLVAVEQPVEYESASTPAFVPEPEEVEDKEPAPVAPPNVIAETEV